MKDENDTKTADLLADGGAIVAIRHDPDRFLRNVVRNGNVGRPRVYGSAAERQKAYRARLRETGKRVVSRIVTDRRGGDSLITSDTIVIPAFYRVR